MGSDCRSWDSHLHAHAQTGNSHGYTGTPYFNTNANFNPNLHSDTGDTDTYTRSAHSYFNVGTAYGDSSIGAADANTSAADADANIGAADVNTCAGAALSDTSATDTNIGV